MNDVSDEVTRYVETAYPFTDQPDDLSPWKVIRELGEVPPGQDWTDLREDQAAAFFGNQVSEEQRRGVDELSEHYEETIDRRFGRQYPWLVDDMSYDLVSVMEARLIGEPSSFFEELFRVYRSGGFPCGWEGDYPDGRLIALFPDRKSL